MILLPTEHIQYNRQLVAEINNTVAATYRLITYCRKHLADDLLNAFLSSTTNLQQLLSIKNAQMEAQNEKEAAYYTKNLNITLDFIIAELKSHVNFENEVQLFQLFRLISPETHQQHPNRYRNNHVQIGRYFCPPPNQVQSLVQQLFVNLKQINNPIIKCIYFHHELIRIHPFSDGNGRTTRIAKNWMLMYELYPPIFIKNEEDKKAYLSVLGRSFATLNRQPNLWNEHVESFFNQELNRLKENVLFIHKSINEIGKSRT